MLPIPAPSARPPRWFTCRRRHTDSPREKLRGAIPYSYSADRKPVVGGGRPAVGCGVRRRILPEVAPQSPQPSKGPATSERQPKQKPHEQLPYDLIRHAFAEDKANYGLKRHERSNRTERVPGPLRERDPELSREIFAEAKNERPERGERDRRTRLPSESEKKQQTSDRNDNAQSRLDFDRHSSPLDLDVNFVYLHSRSCLMHSSVPTNPFLSHVKSCLT